MDVWNIYIHLFLKASFLSFIFTFLQLTHIYVMYAIDVFLTHKTDNRDEHAAVILDLSMFISVYNATITHDFHLNLRLVIFCCKKRKKRNVKS